MYVLCSCRMDGTEIIEIRFFIKNSSPSSSSISGSGLITGLAYSATKHQLYWVSRPESEIFYWDFATRSQGRLANKPIVGQITAMAVHGSSLYYAVDYELGDVHTVYSADAGTGDNAYPIRNATETVLSIRVYAPSLQKTRSDNGCSKDSNCDHLCLPKSDTESVCACAIGFALFNRTACVLRPPNVLIHTSSTTGLSGRSIFPSCGKNAFLQLYLGIELSGMFSVIQNDAKLQSSMPCDTQYLPARFRIDIYLF
jgi:hypothetical protein